MSAKDHLFYTGSQKTIISFTTAGLSISIIHAFFISIEGGCIYGSDYRFCFLSEVSMISCRANSRATAFLAPTTSSQTNVSNICTLNSSLLKTYGGTVFQSLTVYNERYLSETTVDMCSASVGKYGSDGFIVIAGVANVKGINVTKFDLDGYGVLYLGGGVSNNTVKDVTFTHCHSGSRGLLDFGDSNTSVVKVTNINFISNSAKMASIEITGGSVEISSGTFRNSTAPQFIIFPGGRPKSLTLKNVVLDSIINAHINLVTDNVKEGQISPALLRLRQIRNRCQPNTLASKKRKRAIGSYITVSLSISIFN